jgi:tRNA nucleotidyltransferase (CCA-adding enzyme)
VTVVSEGDPIEITTFRTDGEYIDSRRPESVTFSKNVEDDLSRRDFTVNAMAYNERRGLVDLFDGKTDLERRIIRCVGDPEKRFSEDALRIMRAFRFSSQLGFEIEEKTLLAAHSMKNGLKNIAKERIGSEFLRLLSGVAAKDSLLKMGDILDIIIPKTLDTQRFEKIDDLSRDAIPRLAFLLCGASDEEIRDASHSLKLSSKQTQRLMKLTLPPTEKDLENLTEARARRLLAAYGEDTLAVTEIASHLYKIDAASIEILRRVVSEDPPVTLDRLAVNGSDIIKEGIASGRDVGRILSKLLDEVIEHPERNDREILLALAKNNE